MLLETFVRESKKGEECRHLNSIKTDNRLKNLKWGTKKENFLDRIKAGVTNRGEKHPHNKYSQKLILKIRQECKEKMRKDIGKKFNIPTSTIIDICNGGTWGWLK